MDQFSAGGIVVDQMGSFLVLSTLGVTVAGIYSSGRPTAAEIGLFPPFIALTIALLSIPLEYAPWLTALLIYLLYVSLFGAHGQATQVTLFEAAMPPMITAAIIASEHDLDPELSTLMVAVGLLVSFVTLSGWWWVLQGV